jgi:alpha-beta hydrolase superfamily lysophospholipase
MRMLWGLVAFVFIGVVAVIVFGPREPVVTDVRFDAAALEPGIDAYLEQQEARFDDILEDVEKRVIWAGEPEARAAWAILYVHGFSATSEEVRPLPDDLAKALGANLVYTRLAGHGRSGAAMAEASIRDWMLDLAEGLAIARHVGERVLVVGTSTGATLLSLALHEEMGRDVAGAVFVSPNFGVQDPAAALLTWPAARWWAPLVAGRERAWDARNADHDYYWTTAYPTVALLPMAASVKAAAALAHEDAKVPALFVFDPGDEVVNHQISQAVATRWGAEVHPVSVTGRSDPGRHVIAGDIMSPDMTGPLGRVILEWVNGLDAP